jgi:putative glutamine amidotransferase
MKRLAIGISACLFHPDPARPVAASKTLQFIEQSTAHWLAAAGALPVMIPAPAGGAQRVRSELADYAAWLDGLVLHGGADISPAAYGQEPLRPEWSGDPVRDAYEMALLGAFVAAAKPVFGICRGLQLINVAHGGTLYQDLATQKPGARQHRDVQAYEHHIHEVHVLPGTHLSRLLGGERHRVNSIHHQGIRQLAPGFVVEAVSPEDGLVEAIRSTGAGWLAAVQWHPELHHPALGTLDDRPLLRDFLDAARRA